jgi:L-amino acid N-acyltransferase YncA
MVIRPVAQTDEDAVWAILQPVIRAGETMALPRDMDRPAALAHWAGHGRQAFVAQAGGVVLGTSYLRANQTGGGAHVANAGYATAAGHTGRGVARQLCAHSLALARAQGFRAMQFNFVVVTNTRAIRLWQSFGFETVGRLPLAFEHPLHGFCDALVMYLRL